MFSKFKDKLSEVADPGTALAQFMTKIDFEAVATKSGAATREVCKKLDPQKKDEVLSWLDKVHKIRDDSALSSSEKEKQIESLPTTDVVLNFLKAVVDVLVNEAPVENKGLLKTGLSGVAAASSMMSFGMDGVALMIFKKALPKLLLQPQFSILSQFIQQELS
jgi:hypothetical protein